jgi:putative endonuclease
MQNKSQKQGLSGEKLAREYLLEKGYEILEQNWRFRKYEVDIISKKGQTIVFVEVKTRKSGTFGEPEVFVTRQKQNFLIAAANQYIIQNNIDLESRFDIIAILQFNNNHSVKHLEDAFYPGIK